MEIVHKSSTVVCLFPLLFASVSRFDCFEKSLEIFVRRF